MAATATPPAQCSNPDCRIADTGKCVEGKLSSECANFGKARAPDASVKPKAGTPLVSAAALSAAQVVAHLRSSLSRVVAVVAPTGSGKTSLIASTYELFQTGSVGELGFAGSTTLHAFEAACHDARAASLRQVSNQERTPRVDATFYHLQVAGAKAGETALLIADRAGEDYRTVADEPKAVEGLYEVRRADVVTFLVDGTRLLDSGDRHNLRTELRLILKVLVDTSTTQRTQHLAIVLTKLDEVRASQYAARAEKDFEDLTRAIVAAYSDSFASICTFKTAASPKVPGVTRASGVAELLASWIGSEVPIPFVEARPVTPSRSFGALSAEVVRAK